MTAVEYARLGAEVLGWWLVVGLLAVGAWLFLRWLLAPFRQWDPEIRRDDSTLSLIRWRR